MIEPFRGPLLKLRRGEWHLEELRHIIAEFKARLPYYRNAREEPERPGYITSEIFAREAPPEAITMTLGDAIHNMRAALDLLANDLVSLEGKDTKGVCFPFGKNQMDLSKQIDNAKFRRAGPKAVQYLRELAPYPSGDLHLWALHELDISDKHRMVLPAIGWVSSYGGASGSNILEMKPGRIGSTTYFGPSFGADANIVGDKLSVNFEVVFAMTSPIPDRKVVPTLENLAQQLLGIIREFATRSGRNLPDY